MNSLAFEALCVHMSLVSCMMDSNMTALCKIGTMSPTVAAENASTSSWCSIMHSEELPHCCCNHLHGITATVDQSTLSIKG